MLALQTGQLRGAAEAPPWTRKHLVGAFALELLVPLVELIAPHPQFPRDLGDRSAGLLQQAHGFQLERSRERLALSHRTPPGALCSLTGCPRKRVRLSVPFQSDTRRRSVLNRKTDSDPTFTLFYPAGRPSP